MRRYGLTAVTLLVTLGTLSVSPLGQADDQQDAADRLFHQAVALMKTHQYDAAARKLEASHQYDPAFATLMNLAACYERLGKVASAWKRYREAADMAMASSPDPEPQRQATQQAARLETDLPRLVLSVHPATRSLPGLQVSRAGEDVVPSLFDVAIYVDPGEYDIKASAPQHQEFSIRITALKGKLHTVQVPKLQASAQTTRSSTEGGDVADADEPDDATGLGTMRLQLDAIAELPIFPWPEDDDVTSDELEDTAPPGRTRRLIGWAGIGTGAATTIVGLGIGWWAISTWNNAFDSGLCEPDTLICSLDGHTETEKAQVRATVSNLVVGTGLVLAAAGTWLVWTASDRGHDTHVVPSLGPDESVGLTMVGRF